MGECEHDMATILSEAAELSVPADRQAYLDRVCAGDHALRQRVEQLLRYHARAGQFLEQPAVVLLAPPAATASLIGSWIGPYRLLEQIGEGGFGTVYMAEQVVPVRRKVALKILKPGMDSREVIARFEAERQALAMMDHPHIARVLDAGATDSGRPYFVMELVRGVCITQYCDQARLSTRERLLLFADVCRAVQHAHLKGIIHRDLKPGNVLVTLHDDRAVVKVIDFGIAKAISQPLTDRTLFTGFHQLLGTPLYMSPEQAQYNGLDVDTRSDVYSLGVLLYELLTGTTPFAREDMLTASVDELRRLICEQEPQRPSARVSTMHLQARTTMADQRRLDRRRPGEQLRGELDWIVMRALEKDRNRRYESASALATDIERYLRNEAVAACPPSLGYRFQKFARRNRPLLVTLLLVAVSLVVGIIGTSWQALRAAAAEQLADQRRQEADRRLEAAMGAIEKLLSHVGNPELAEVPQLQATHEKILRDSLEFYDRFTSEFGATPALLFRAADVLGRLGSYARDSSQRAQAKTAYAQAIQIIDRLVQQAPDRLEYRIHQAQIYLACGACYVESEGDDPRGAALPYLQHAESLFRALAVTEPGNKEFLSGQAEALRQQADLCQKLSPHDPRVAVLIQRAYELSEKSRPSWRIMAVMARSLATSDHTRAEELYRRALQLAQSESLTTRRDRYGYAHLRDAVATFLNSQQPRQAEQLWTESIHDLSMLSREFPTIIRYSNFLSSVARRYSGFLMAHGRSAEARQIIDQLVSHFPESYDLHRLRAEFLRNPDESETSIAELTAATREYPGISEYFAERGQLYQSIGDLDAALRDLDQAVALHADRPALPPDTHAIALSNVLSARSELHYARGEYQLAVADAAQSIQLRPQASHLYKRRYAALFQLQSYRQAIADLQRSVQLSPTDHSALIWVPVDQLARCSDAEFREGYLAVVDEAVALDYRSAEALLLRAAVLLEFGEQTRAMQDLQTVIAGENRLSPIHSYQAAVVALQCGNQPVYRQIAAAVIAAAQDSSDLDTLVWACWTASLVPGELDDYQPALAVADRALELNPRLRTALEAKGAILMQMGRHQEALLTLQEALRQPSVYSPPAYVHFLLAMTCACLQQHDDAQTRLTAAHQVARRDLATFCAWQSRLLLLQVRREAGTLIGSVSDQSDP